MPRKATSKKTAPVPVGPSQAEFARLLNDSLDMVATQVVQMLSTAENNEDINLSRDNLIKIRDNIEGIKTKVQNSSVDQLLRYY